MKASPVQLVSYTALFAALAVLGSAINFPMGPVRIMPFQHTINAVAGMIIGPWYGALAALLAGLIRMMLGTGTVFAIPGGIPGVMVVGLVYRYGYKSDYAAFLEPVGTVFIGATLSALVVAPLVGKSATLGFFQISFLMSCVPGCSI
ncbi:MAG: energy coupling factor transporter S component ThiW, partial [Atribacterota bacterium]